MRTRTACKLWGTVAVTWVALILGGCGQPKLEPGAVHLTPKGEAIQDVLDRLAPGATVVLSSGQWAVNLRISKSVVLRGAGPGKTFLQAGGPNVPVVTVSGGQDVVVRLEGLTVRRTRGIGGHGLVAEGQAQVEVANCEVTEVEGNGVVLRGESKVVLQRATVAKGTWGLEVGESAHLRLEGSTVADHRHFGLWMGGSARVEAVGLTVAGNQGHGIWVQDQSELSLANSSVLRNQGRGIWTSDEGTLEARQTKVSQNGQQGVYLEGRSRGILEDCLLEENRLGVEAGAMSEVRVAGCTVQGTAWDGIRVTGRARADLQGNSLSQGKGSGIAISGLAQVGILYNRIDGWTQHGILCRSPTSPWGTGNRMWANGTDLAGNVGPELRVPRREATELEVYFPHPSFQSLQEALDALLPRGTLIVREGRHVAGLTVDKSVFIQGEGRPTLIPLWPRQTAVVAVIGDGDVSVLGVEIREGTEGTYIAGAANVKFRDCTFAENERAVHTEGAGVVELQACSLLRSTQVALWLGERTTGVLVECRLEDNQPTAVTLADTARGTFLSCTFTGNGWTAALALRDSAHATIEGCQFTKNFGAGVVLYHGLCVTPGYSFRGRVQGGGNVMVDNYKGDVCPEDLRFLLGEYGTLDWRR